MSWDGGLVVPVTSRGSLDAAADMASGSSEERGRFEDGVAHRIRGLPGSAPAAGCQAASAEGLLPSCFLSLGCWDDSLTERV